MKIYKKLLLAAVDSSLNTMKKILTVFIACLLASGANAASSDCVTDGQEITLTGTMKVGQFAGPPNFESVKDGDKLLTYWYLETPKPLCAFTDSSLEGKALEKIEPQSRFQLVIKQQLNKLNEMFNQNASITAVPFTAHTGYHQTPLVLEVKQFEKVD